MMWTEWSDPVCVHTYWQLDAVNNVWRCIACEQIMEEPWHRPGSRPASADASAGLVRAGVVQPASSPRLPDLRAAGARSAQ